MGWFKIKAREKPGTTKLYVPIRPCNSNQNLQNTDCLFDYDEKFDQAIKTNFNTVTVNDPMRALGAILIFHIYHGALISKFSKIVIQIFYITFKCSEQNGKVLFKD